MVRPEEQDRPFLEGSIRSSLGSWATDGNTKGIAAKRRLEDTPGTRRERRA